ncbi:hypothetical protein G9C98_003285 [Cotesia typhae]|uniref:Uncharacterized protein n=1 Tax=Cotesia typhae TaxID=2053667 RepID=A0A8J5R5A2_9HYME|nr:hypothetical protein G9C98_003285 [Cotesia typhae]
MIIEIGPQHPEAQHIAVSHHGLRLIKRSSNGELVILETLPLEDIVSVGSARANVCTLTISSGVRLPLHTTRAPQLAEMISNFIRVEEIKKAIREGKAFKYSMHAQREFSKIDQGRSTGLTVECIFYKPTESIFTHGKARTCRKTGNEWLSHNKP